MEMRIRSPKLTDSVINGTIASAHTPLATVVVTAATATSLLSETTHEKLPPLAEILHIVPLHATKVLHHAARVANKGVKICTGVVPKAHRDSYQDLHEKMLGKSNKKASEFSDCLLHQIMFFHQIKITHNSICLIADAAYAMDEEIARTQSRVTSAIINSSRKSQRS